MPDNVLKLDFRGADGLVALARSPRVSFVASDGDQQLFRRVWRELGRTVEGQKSLKALISTLDGPQPGQPGFVRRFAWPKVVAIRTLRHGADLALARRD